MTKRIIATTIAMGVALSLVGCGEESTEQKTVTKVIMDDNDYRDMVLQ